jgi:excisionase family DNA binding protein
MTTEEAETNLIMTVREVSEYLRMGESTIYRLANEGKLPGRKIGGGWRFSKKELDRWVAQPRGKKAKGQQNS